MEDRNDKLDFIKGWCGLHPVGSICCGSNKQIHTDYWILVEKKGWHSHSLKGRVPWPLSQGESTSTLALTGFYCLSNNVHQRRFSFIMLKSALGNYFLQITKERMLLITSYRLTRKKMFQSQGNDKRNWSGYTSVLGRISTDFRKLL